MQEQFLLSVNHELTTEPGNKPDMATGKDWQELTPEQRIARMSLTHNWKKVTLTLDEIAEHVILNGYTFSSGFGGAEKCVYEGCNGKRYACKLYGRHRCNANFQAAQIFAIDLDHLAKTTADVLQHIVINRYAFLVHHTASSRPGAPRLRALFALETPIIGKPQSAKDLIEAMMWKFEGDADPACSDICRIFYGNYDAEIALENYDRVLPVAVAHSWVEEYRQFRKELEAFDRWLNQVNGNITTGRAGVGELPDSTDSRAKNYARKVLQSAAGNVQIAPERHPELIRQCLKIAPYVLAGYLTDYEASETLKGAFLAATSGEKRNDFDPAWKSALRKATHAPYFPSNWNAPKPNLTLIGGSK